MKTRNLVLLMLCVTVIAPIVLYTDRFSASFKASSSRNQFLEDLSAFTVGGDASHLNLLPQPKLNNSLLEMFRNEYIGTAPYISCTPSLHHHRLCPRDQFLILSSDGLYQYLTNQEVVSNVESFMEKFPDGDPAQHLIEELLFHAADKAGKMFFLLCLFL
ncbi:hypothetical protein Patl1_30371 [Pistacia atlantica]|uniref:Uncharacterized protein n=1 Tax=Pistacia atlantica TaxID=434234 RepID=A0ACC1AAN5_9ROSI|nr:hypothetical protein Patl1_30371 [Pistacia atlantica]